MDSLKIKNYDGLDISCNLYRKSNSEILPLIIFSHGFKGFKDWGGFPYMMNQLANAGFAAASFNFTHNGVSQKHPMEFTELDNFAKNTFSREVKELSNVIDYFYSNVDELMIDKNRIALMGHSRGGGATIINGANDERVNCVITLSSISAYDRYTERQKELWKKNGFIEIENARTKQMMRMNYTLIEDLELNKEQLDIPSAMKHLNKPCLLIHGKEDLAVKSDEAKKLFETSNKDLTELYIIERTGHTFGISHPFAGTTDAFEKVIESSVNFLKKILV